MLSSNDKGNIAEAAIALEAIKLGIDVLKPVAEHGRYDLAFDLGRGAALPGAVQAGFAGRTLTWSMLNCSRCRTRKRGYVERDLPNPRD